MQGKQVANPWWKCGFHLVTYASWEPVKQWRPRTTHSIARLNGQNYHLKYNSFLGEKIALHLKCRSQYNGWERDGTEILPSLTRVCLYIPMAILKQMRFGKLPHHVKSVSKSDLHSSEVTKFTHQQLLKRLWFLAISMEYFSTMETL
mgnify:CR=1 FL=1